MAHDLTHRLECWLVSTQNTMRMPSSTFSKHRVHQLGPQFRYEGVLASSSPNFQEWVEFICEYFSCDIIISNSGVGSGIGQDDRPTNFIANHKRRSEAIISLQFKQGIQLEARKWGQPRQL